ncbi:MAG: hypothetical protein ACOC0Q_01430 [Wenzhouxiangella sp.]
MFKPNPKRTFQKAVSFNVPGESGAFQQVQLPVDFISIPRSELRTLQEEATDDEVYERVVAGVHEVGGENGQALSPPDGKNAMAEESAFVYQAMLTYYDVMLGGNLKGKTSRRRGATG